jgi:tRNA-Thr(GGU) m(6)t(6)A37 methyltransferase TsaA
MATSTFTIRPVGVVESSIRHRRHAPFQGDEAGIESTVRLHESMLPAAKDLAAGDRVLVLTWLHAAGRHALAVHPRADPFRPLTGVFSTRSEHRPNPIGLHEVDIVGISGCRLTVRGLEAIDGTPVADIKPVLGPKGQR